MTFPPLVVVRHGETDWNAAGRLQGQTDIPLNARGRDQADAVGRTLRDAIAGVGSYAFVASPLARARETMERMRIALGLPAAGALLDDRLRELSFGRWEGFSMAEIKLRDPKAFRTRKADKWNFRPAEGESYADLEARVGALVSELQGPTVIVAHGGVSRVLLGLVGGVARDQVPDVAIVQGRALLFEADGWRLV